MSPPTTGASSPEVEATLVQLLSAERLIDAAELCATHGQHARAAFYFERAASFAKAAEQALLGGDGATAMRLAAASADEDLLARIAGALEPRAAAGIAGELAARQKPLAAAYAFARAGEPVAAGESFEAAEQMLRAAQAYRAGGDAVRAARVLAVLRKSEPDNAAAALLLGEVLATAGRDHQAVRALQAVPAGAPEHAPAQRLLATLFTRLGLPAARESLGDVVPAEAPTEPRGAGEQPLLFGRYEHRRLVASSPNARVIEARDRLGGHLVAVKLLQPSGSPAGRDALQRFEREARALTVLRHAHVLPLLAFHPEGPAAVFPWMAGGALSARLERGPLPPEHAAFVAAALLDAVDAAHGAGILHRDIKPSNVLFDAALSPCLADFGAAHVGEADSTVTAGLIGSLAYMAPEQLAAEPASAASDLYAVGAVFYEALSGRAPRPVDELEALPSTLFPDELGPAHDELFRRLLARAPSDRFGTAREAREAVRALGWAARGAPRAVPRREDARAVGTRLRRTSTGGYVDEILRREVVPLEASLLPLARAVAALDSPAIELVLRVEPLTSSPWIERAEGPTLAEGAAPPSHDEAAALRTALWALHASGHALGEVDEAAIVRTVDGLRFRFPRRPPSEGADGRRAIEAEQQHFEAACARWRALAANRLCSRADGGEETPFDPAAPAPRGGRRSRRACVGGGAPARGEGARRGSRGARARGAHRGRGRSRAVPGARSAGRGPAPRSRSAAGSALGDRRRGPSPRRRAGGRRGQPCAAAERARSRGEPRAYRRRASRSRRRGAPPRACPCRRSGESRRSRRGGRRRDLARAKIPPRTRMKRART